MKYIRNIVMIGLLFFTFLIQSCSEDDKTSFNDGESSIIEVAKRTTAASSFLAAIEASDSDLNSLLGGNADYTVFAPTNAAFNQLLADLDGFESLEDFDTPAEKALLADVLNYHVVAGSTLSSELTDGQVLPTVLGTDIGVAINDDGITLQDATTDTAIEASSLIPNGDITAKNGVIHFVNRVLLTQDIIDAVNLQPTLTQLVNFEASLSSLKEALDITGLGEALAGDGSFAVFAPTNDAFADLLDALGEEYDSIRKFDNPVEIALLSDVLSYHVIQDSTTVADGLSVGIKETILANNTIELTASGADFMINDESGDTASTIGEDIVGGNGFARTIDKVLLPQAAFDFIALLGSPNFAEALASDANFSILNEAVIALELEGVLSGENAVLDEDGEVVEHSEFYTYYNPATVFAPNNAAFNALFDLLGSEYSSIADFDTDAELTLLKEIVLYHIISSEVKSDKLGAGAVTTDSGADLQIISRGSDFVIGDATNDINAVILNADIDVKNGVVHEIDKVLQPIELIEFISKL